MTESSNCPSVYRGTSLKGGGSSKRSAEQSSRSRREAIATIGSFDGVHRGHRSLLAQVRSIADERGMKAVAVTFGSSPKRVLGRGDVPVLNTIEERTTLLRQAGMDEVKVLDFTPQIAAMPARDFMQQVLKDELHVAVLIIGYDHRFGHGRTEGFDDYVRYGKEMGIEVVRGEACIEGNEPVSSTRIRHLLAEGNVDEANHLLGYRYMLHGEVVDGYKEGRKMGFPTANLRLLDDDKLIPADGVYAVRVSVGQWTEVDNCHPEKQNISREDVILSEANGSRAGTWPGHDARFFTTFRMTREMTDNAQQTGEDNSELRIQNSAFKLTGMLNIGYRPTLNNGRERSIEVHILDFEGMLYGKDITVEFVHRLREERMFANVEELTEQLRKDEERVRELLGLVSS